MYTPDDNSSQTSVQSSPLPSLSVASVCRQRPSLLSNPEEPCLTIHKPFSSRLTLERLPPELIARICRYLDLGDRRNLAFTSTALAERVDLRCFREAFLSCYGVPGSLRARGCHDCFYPVYRRLPNDTVHALFGANRTGDSGQGRSGARHPTAKQLLDCAMVLRTRSQSGRLLATSQQHRQRASEAIRLTIWAGPLEGQGQCRIGFCHQPTTPSKSF